MGTYFSVLTLRSSLAAHTIVIILRAEPLKDGVLSYGGKPAVTQYRGRGRLTSDFACLNETVYSSQVYRLERAGPGTDSPVNWRRTRHALSIHPDIRARAGRGDMWR